MTGCSTVLQQVSHCSCPANPLREKRASTLVSLLQHPLQHVSESKIESFLCQGKGIFLIRDVEKVPVDFSSTYVAQRSLGRKWLAN